MSKPNLSIIIVNYNTKKLLRECLTSIINHQSSIIKLEIIVVDNGSKDGTVEMVKKMINGQWLMANRRMINDQWLMINRERRNQPSTISHQPLVIRLIENKTNLGFAKAVNQGIKKAEGEYILLLNSDTRMGKETLERLLEFAEKHPEADVIGPKLVLPSGQTQVSCRNLPTIKRAILEYWLGKKGAYDFFLPGSSAAVEVESVMGAAMLIPKKVFEKVGFFDERYFMYFEDLDFCRRVKKSGFKIYYLPEVEIFHHHGASGKKISERTYQWLFESSKIYHGTVRHFFINFIIWSGQKWQKNFGKK